MSEIIEQQLSRIINIVAELRDLNEEKISVDQLIFEQLGFDSLSFLELIVTLESELEIEDFDFDELVMTTDDLTIRELISILKSTD